MSSDRSSTRPPRRRLPEWVIGFLLAIVVTAAALWVLGQLGAGDDPSFEAPGTSETERSSRSFVMFDGTVTSFDAFAGKPMVLNFWASWCPPCAAEMPDFQAVHDRLGDRVTFLGMNSQDVDRAAAEHLVAATGVTYLLASDPDGSLFQEFGGVGMPTTVFIDEEGRVVASHSGILFAEDLERQIRDLFEL